MPASGRNVVLLGGALNGVCLSMEDRPETLVLASASKPDASRYVYERQDLVAQTDKGATSLTVYASPEVPRAELQALAAKCLETQEDSRRHYQGPRPTLLFSPTHPPRVRPPQTCG